MFLDISANDFRRIFKDEIFHLPLRWDGKDFHATIQQLFRSYCRRLTKVVGCSAENIAYCEIERICDLIALSINEYFNGYPSRAFNELSSVMNHLMESPFKTYQKTGWDDFLRHSGDPLKLYRLRNVQQNIKYQRSDIFHTPYDLRSKVATFRYSIAGYPSLYLGTSLELCGEESKTSYLNELQIASRFELVRNKKHHHISIRVIELAVKPQDFFEETNENIDKRSRRYFDEIKLESKKIRSAYLLWYPLIAVCSFIRVSKADPFAAEYIIPQLLMQWIRNKYEYDELYGIRYFSCASVRASEMGFNYVFPVSGRRYKASPFCEELAQSFRLTVPRYIHEFQSWDDCERALTRDSDLDFI